MPTALSNIKRASLGLAFVAASFTATAQTTEGVLINSEIAGVDNGQIVYRCTYTIGTGTRTVTVTGECPVTMQVPLF